MTEAPADRRRWICPICQKAYLIPPEVGDPARCAKCEKKERRNAAKADAGTIELPAGDRPNQTPADDAHLAPVSQAPPSRETAGFGRWHTACAWLLTSTGALGAIGGIAWGVGTRRTEVAISCTGLLVALLIWQSLLLVLHELRALRQRA